MQVYPLSLHFQLYHRSPTTAHRIVFNNTAPYVVHVIVAKVILQVAEEEEESSNLSWLYISPQALDISKFDNHIMAVEIFPSKLPNEKNLHIGIVLNYKFSSHKEFSATQTIDVFVSVLDELENQESKGIVVE